MLTFSLTNILKIDIYLKLFIYHIEQSIIVLEYTVYNLQVHICGLYL